MSYTRNVDLDTVTTQRLQAQTARSTLDRGVARRHSFGMEKPRYKTPNFRTKHMGNVSVDSDGRVFLFGQEASAIVADERFHFFEEALPADDWARVRAFHQLPKTKYHSTKAHGVRRGEGHIVGIAPKRPITDIQDERGKEAGEKSFRMAAYGKAFERLVAKDMAASGQTPMTEDEAIAAFGRRADEDDDLPF